MAIITGLSHLANPSAVAVQLETSSSHLDGIPKDLEDSVRFESSKLLQAAGILLRLPQELIAQSIIILCRYWIGADGGSMLDHDPNDAAAAALYMTAKPSPHPVSVRQVSVVFSYLTFRSGFDYKMANEGDVTNWHISGSDYEAARSRLHAIEAHILQVLGFATHVALPFTLCINYLQTLDVFKASRREGEAVAKLAFQHLNTALLSPQLLYLTHQPTALATAAIYLAAREVKVKLPETSWWEVFDVDREELGFLAVAMRSVEGFAREERLKWEGRRVPMTIEGLREEIERRRTREVGGER